MTCTCDLLSMILRMCIRSTFFERIQAAPLLKLFGDTLPYTFRRSCFNVVQTRPSLSTSRKPHEGLINCHLPNLKKTYYTYNILQTYPTWYYH